MTLCIQDPTDPASEYLIDTLLAACTGATRGGGAFAFLSKGGVQLFLRDRGFSEFAEAGAFDLVVGVDAITDTAAIAALDAVRADLPSLGASVHIPTHPRSIFHPKFAWFEKPGGGVLVTGSGNLTAGGLRWNVEAFNVSTLNTCEIGTVSGQWDAFKARSAANLFDTADPMVVARLQRNAERRIIERARPPSLRLASPGEPLPAEPLPPEAHAEVAADVDAIPLVAPTTEVLVAEIPQSGSRWKQANFSQETFINFFGASTTVARTAYLFHVRADGTVGEQERRPAVVVASHNYRFELDAAAGIDYPPQGRPIGLFVRIATRTFTYMLVLPGDPVHLRLALLLQTEVPNAGRQMRRVVLPAQQVQMVWPDSPLWGSLSI
jgi:hypothetical protein